MSYLALHPGSDALPLQCPLNSGNGDDVALGALLKVRGCSRSERLFGWSDAALRLRGRSTILGLRSRPRSSSERCNIHRHERRGGSLYQSPNCGYNKEWVPATLYPISQAYV